jgi:hypothetical protein
MSIQRLLVCAMVTVLITPGARAQECPPRDADAAAGRARRDAAIEYITAINTAQTRAQKQSGKYAPLNELSGVPSAPVGLIPKLLLDQWSYMVSLRDYFDECGLALFSDERGVIYQAHSRIVTSPKSAEAGDESTATK